MVRVLPKPRNQPREATRPVTRRKRATKPGRRIDRAAPSRPALRAKRKFLRHFPGGFRDQTYLDWERGYKWDAHQRWQAALGESAFTDLVEAEKFEEIAATAIRIESRTNLLFSFEKMALRDAVRSRGGAKAFALGLFDLLHGPEAMEVRFANWIERVARLPRRQTRVLTWPLVTVFGFIAQPSRHFFLKPMVTREAARRYGIELGYASRPSWPLYKDLLDFVALVRNDIRELRPRDMIDLQSYLWCKVPTNIPTRLEAPVPRPCWVGTANSSSAA
jgi:hypothetical protein